MRTPKSVDLTKIAEEPLAGGEAQPASTGERRFPGRFAASGINVTFALDRVEVVRALRDGES